MMENGNRAYFFYFLKERANTTDLNDEQNMTGMK